MKTKLKSKNRYVIFKYKFILNFRSILYPIINFLYLIDLVIIASL